MIDRVIKLFFIYSFALTNFCFVKAEGGFKGIWYTLGQPKPYGDKYSGGLGTYTAKHLPLAVYSETVNKTFFTYGGISNATDNQLLIMISYYDHGTQKLAQPIKVYDKSNVTDPHDNATIQLDSEGYIWIFVSGRYSERNGYVFRSDTPYDIQNFTEVLNEPFNYPQPKYLKDKGFILLHTNYGNGRELFSQRSADGYAWTPDKKLVNFGGHYQVSGNTDDKVGFAFNWHEGGSVDQRTNLYYMRTLDIGETWQTVNGTALTTPLTNSSNPALVKDYSALGLKVYLKDIRYNKDGYPIILYITSPTFLPGPTDTAREWNIARWNGEEWFFSTVTEANHNYDMGSLYLDDDGTYRILAPTDAGPQVWGTGGEMVIWESDDEGLTWINLGAITENSSRNHTYARRPLNCNPDFYALWADGNTETFSRSYLYFSNKYGDVFQMPYEFNESSISPIPFANKVEIYPQIVSSTKSIEGYPALKLVDGLIDDDSRWESRFFPQSIVIDYGEETSFNSAKMQTLNNRSYNYTLALSSDVNFEGKTIFEKVDSSFEDDTEIDAFDESTGRYAKLTITGQNNISDGYIRITEFLLGKEQISTSLSVMNTNKLRAYPNPVKQNKFSIEGINPYSIIEIYSPSGVLLFSGNAMSNTVHIDCSNFPEGIILVNILSETQNQTIKMIIDK